MLGLIFRGVFLIGILSWYSVNVWKLIDGYFKDQFERYLQDEYRKDPRIKSDVESSRSTSLPEGPVTDVPLASERQLEETRNAETLPIDTVYGDGSKAAETTGQEARGVGKAGPCTSDTGEPREGPGSIVVASENGATAGSTDKNAFLEAAESAVESRKPLGRADGTSREPINQADETARKSEVSNDEPGPQSANERRSADQGRRSIEPRTMQRHVRNRQDRHKRVQTVVLTAKDFASVKGKREPRVVDDFWEFEEDRQERKQEEGIAVADLPFKPRADIGHLDRVSPEEYCPLTSEDEVTCGETVGWP